MESRVIIFISSLEKCHFEEYVLLESLVTIRKNLNKDAKIKAQKSKQDQEEFEKMVKEHKLMTVIMVLPFFNPFELAKFSQLNKACFQLMLIVNFRVLFEA